MANTSTEEVLQLLSHLLCDYKPEISEELDQACDEYPGLRDIVEIILNLRVITSSLSKGELEESVSGQGFVVSNLKALQSNLHHLVWQLAQVSKGDFSQRIDFLGDFSKSFNLMCEHLEAQNLSLTELAQYDGLTKLANRYYLDQYLNGLFDRSRKTDTVFCLAMVDLDFFKNVNDTYGHDVGDIVLERVAEYLHKVFRATDFIARFGGEEFIVVLPGMGKDQAMQTAERVRKYFVEHPIIINEDLAISITVSIGVSELEESDESWDQIVKRSDVALYAAKNGGRNKVEFR